MGFRGHVECAWVHVIHYSRWLLGRSSGHRSDIGEGTYVVVRTQTPCVCKLVSKCLSSFANVYDCQLFAAAETLPVSESFVNLLREILVRVLLWSVCFFYCALLSSTSSLLLLFSSASAALPVGLANGTLIERV